MALRVRDVGVQNYKFVPNCASGTARVVLSAVGG